MRNIFILTGFLLVFASLACLVGAQKSNVLKAGVLKTNLKNAQGAVLGFPYHPFPEVKEDALINKVYTRSTEGNVLEKYRELTEKAEQLERICAECRLVLEKSQIPDSVYDQYDNPQGRLHPYKVNMVLKRLFRTAKALNDNRIEQERLKRQFSAR